MTRPSVPTPIAQALSRYPEPVKARLLDIRALIFALAEETEGVGQLTETLKWGEPAYLTQASKSGSTIRLGATKSAPDKCAVLFNCNTTLVDTFKSHFASTFSFEGNRALLVPTTGALPVEPLSMCLRAALTYHRNKAAKGRP